MTAQEAKAKASENVLKKFDFQLGEILKSIEACANKGEFHCNYYENINPNVKETLRNLGYVVKSESFRNEELTTISWA
jgi:hypothetical protein